MRADWDRLRSMIYSDIGRLIAQEKASEQDYCVLKTMLSSLEKSYTNEMFERQRENGSYEEYPSGVRYNNNSSYGYNGPQAYHGYSGYNSRGNYNQGYSGHGDQKMEFKEGLQNMLMTANDPNTRRIIQEAMEKLN